VFDGQGLLLARRGSAPRAPDAAPGDPPPSRCMHSRRRSPSRSAHAGAWLLLAGEMRSRRRLLPTAPPAKLTTRIFACEQCRVRGESAPESCERRQTRPEVLSVPWICRPPSTCRRDAREGAPGAGSRLMLFATEEVIRSLAKRAARASRRGGRLASEVTVLPVEAARATASAFAVYFERSTSPRSASDRAPARSERARHPRPIAESIGEAVAPSPPRRHLRADARAPRDGCGSAGADRPHRASVGSRTADPSPRAQADLSRAAARRSAPRWRGRGKACWLHRSTRHTTAADECALSVRPVLSAAQFGTPPDPLAHPALGRPRLIGIFARWIGGERARAATRPFGQDDGAASMSTGLEAVTGICESACTDLRHPPSRFIRRQRRDIRDRCRVDEGRRPLARRERAAYSQDRIRTGEPHTAGPMLSTGSESSSEGA